MTIDWKKEVESRKEDLLNDLVELLKVKSEREDDKKSEDAPFGPGPKAALLHMLGYGERDGFTVKNVDNYAGHIEYGEGDETLGIFCHMDVVPAGDGWDTDPYVPVIKDNRIYARGSSDDKGPSIAAYYALKIIRDLNLPISKKIRFVVGSDEESGWGDMDYYFQHEEKPDFGFSPDAEFPIINGEKGNVSLRLHFASTNTGAVRLDSFKAGLRENMVPGKASAKVTFNDELQAKTVADSFNYFLTSRPVSGEAKVDGNVVTFEVVGKSAHGASPHLGVNAGTYLAAFLSSYEFAGGAKDFLSTIEQYIHEDVYGEKFDIAHEDEKMGKLTMNAGLFSFEADGEDAYVNLNFRYPKGTSATLLTAGMMAKIGANKVKIEERPHHMKPHYVPADDPLVATLLAVYEEHTGQKGEEQIIGGGTFGRLLERGVAYGAMFPDYIDTMHQANEFMDLDDLFNATAIYADAIYRLAK
ncbi:dipeptidase PepV [Enterococcus cecorum]|uniref:dipeptidase PepV n=1 Tax=Enterococcus cecorum TaxID=44008 RepID=UPI00148CC2DE|nr:dipeptidase PepV [Enterococcus cecorum]MCJ0581306.1 dipeptidase PepV [Enterococcus cecorum]